MAQSCYDNMTSETHKGAPDNGHQIRPVKENPKQVKTASGKSHAQNFKPRKVGRVPTLD